MTTIQIADIASYEAGFPLDGIDAICVKATEDGGQIGNRYQNPDYARVRDGMLAKGGILEAYHFLRKDNPVGEADYALGIIGTKVPTMIDAEASGVNLDDVLAFEAEFRKGGGILAECYFPRWYAASLGITDLTPLTRAGIHLVASSYPGGHTYPGDTSPGWAAYCGVQPGKWQWDDAYPLNGYKVDINAFRGDLSQYRAYLFSSVPAPVPPAPSYPAWPGYVFIDTPAMAGTFHAGVKTWQQRMRDRGWAITVDGFYGPQSAGVCLAFQKDSTAHGWPLAEDSEVGPNTWKASWLRPITH